MDHQEEAIKTSLKYQFTHVRVVIDKTTKSGIAEHVENTERLHPAEESYILAAVTESCLSLRHLLKMGLLRGLVIPFLGLYPKVVK